jgi:SAM-dependent methyltransferase
MHKEMEYKDHFVVRVWNVYRRINPFFHIFPSGDVLKMRKIFLFKKYSKEIFRSNCNKALDLGSGKYLSLPREVYPPSFEIYALDLFPPNDYPFSVKASAIKIPFRSNSFGLVVASELIEHVESPEELIKEIIRVLAPDGVAVITTPWLHDIFTQPERYILRPLVERALKRGGILKKILNPVVDYWVESRKRGELHISWASCLYWRKLLSKYFSSIVEVGILPRPFKFSRNPIVNFLLGSSMFYICYMK